MLYNSAARALEQLSPQWRWPHFQIAEFSCKCAGRFCDGAYWHEPVFLDALEMLRAEIGKPLVINSAHRCAQWNAAIGGAPFSRHKTLAVDISLRRHDRFAVLRAARVTGFSGLGLARNFIHLDRRAVPATWFYGGSKEAWQTL